MNSDTNQETIEREKPTTENKIKWLSAIFGGIFILTWIILLILAIQQKSKLPEDKINLIPALIITGILALVCVFTFFFNSITKRFKNEEPKIPLAISEEKVKEILRHCLTNDDYMEHVKGFGDFETYEIGHNTIYLWELKPLLNKNTCYAILNANYPEKGVTILGYSEKINKNSKIIKDAINKKSTNPIYEDIEKRTEVDLSSGKSTEYIKKSQTKKQTEEKKEQPIV